jgi:hypothetical protein
MLFLKKEQQQNISHCSHPLGLQTGKKKHLLFACLGCTLFVTEE